MMGHTSCEASITSASTSAILWLEGPGQRAGQGGASAGASQRRGLYSGDATPRMDAFLGQLRQASVAAGMTGARHPGGHGHDQVQHRQQQHHHHHQLNPQQGQAAMHAGAVGYGNPIVVPYGPYIRKYGPGWGYG